MSAAIRFKHLVVEGALLLGVTLSSLAGYAQSDIPTPRGCPVGGCGSDSGDSGGSRSNNVRRPPSAAEIAASQAHELNDQGNAAYAKKDWATADAAYQKALELNPASRVIRGNLSNAQSLEGEDAYRKGDYTAALNFFQQAIANHNPDLKENHFLKDDLDATQRQIAFARNQQEQGQRDKIAAGSIQQSIRSLSQTLNAAPSSGGLDFNDGQDTKAGDQLLSTAATANSRGDLRTNYDRGGAQAVGSLKIPAKPSVDPATFSAKERNDPRMVTALKQLDALNAKRTQLGTELERLTIARNLEKDPQKSQELTTQLNRKNDEVQTNLLSITKAEATAKKTKRTIESEVEAPKADTAKP